MKSSKQKSLGQIAFEQYVKDGIEFSAYEGPDWKSITSQEKRDWHAVARAVSTAVRARQKRKELIYGITWKQSKKKGDSIHWDKNTKTWLKGQKRKKRK